MTAIHLSPDQLTLTGKLARRIGRAINDVRTARYERVLDVTRATKTHHRTIYQIEAGDSANAKLGTIVKLLDHVGLELVVVPKRTALPVKEG